MSTGRQHKQYLARAYAMGGSTTVPADQARKVLADLAETMSYSTIAAALGTSHTFVGRVIRGEIKRTSPERHAAIMSLAGTVQPKGGSQVPALGTTRRLQALHALGYSWVRIAEHTPGYSLTAIKNTGNGRVPTVKAKNARMIADVYERLSMRLPQPVDQYDAGAIAAARNAARRHGWVVPLAWDDPDDPNERPESRMSDEQVGVDENVVTRVLAGDFGLRANAAERSLVARRWVAAGGSLNELSRRTGWKVERYYKASDEEAA